MEFSHRFFENRSCSYFPCHKGLSDCNCLFCFCPLYPLERCPGTPVYLENGTKRIKDCSGCTFPHEPEHYEVVVKILEFL